MQQLYIKPTGLLVFTFNTFIIWILLLGLFQKEGRPSWLFGSDITAADVTLVITLFRLSNLGLSQLWEGKLPKLERYFIYARENFPGFKTVTENGF